jgi:hypothetical protein
MGFGGCGGFTWHAQNGLREQKVSSPEATRTLQWQRYKEDKVELTAILLARVLAFFDATD